MHKRDICYELANFSKWEIFQIIRGSLSIKKYWKLTDEDNIDEDLEELEKGDK